MNKHNLKVGQTLFVKLARDYRGSVEPKGLDPYVVEKIGRVWAKLKHPYYRVNIETLALDGSRGSVYLSEQQYKNQVELQRAWRDFCMTVRTAEYRCPSHITLEAIKEARLKLGL